MANTKGVAPICNAPPEQPTFLSKPPTFPHFSPPSADNIPSLVQSILHLQMAFQAITNQQTVVNNTINGFPATGGGVAAGGGGGVPGFGRGGGGSPNQITSDWTETSRQTQNVKVVNPDDDSQFVIVKEITSITFTRDATGEQFTIKRDP